MHAFDRELLKSKVHGCLAALAVGDALGYPAHEMHRDEIERRFGGPLTSFHSPFPDNPYHPACMRPGEITDDTLMTLVVFNALIEAGGDRGTRLDATFFGRVFAEWARKNRVWEESPMFGPTTKKRFARLVQGEDPLMVGTSGVSSTDGATNGAAMRVSPAGLFYPQNPDSAVELAVQVSLPTHGTNTAIAGAAAVAAAVSEACRKGADVSDVIRAAIGGAREGERLGRRFGRKVPAPDMALRIEMAVDAARRAPIAAGREEARTHDARKPAGTNRLTPGVGDVFEACRAAADTAGTGMLAYETVPAALGVFAAAGGDPARAVEGGANIGGDTDTIASIAGAVAGALMGFEKVPRELAREVEAVNTIDFESLAEVFAEVVGLRLRNAR